MKRYNNYKPSGVDWIGDIPEHWSNLPLFATINERFEKNTAEQVDDVLSLSYGKIILRDVSGNFGLLPESFKTYQIAYPNDIIIRPTDLQNDQRSLRVGKVRQKGIITSAYICLQPTNIDADYVHYLLFAYDLIKIYYKIGAGVRQTLKFEDLKRLPILIPPYSEQTAIAKHLDEKTEQIDKLIANKRRLIGLLKEERTAIINQAITRGINEHAKLKFSGIDWLGNIPENWDVKKFTFFAPIITCGLASTPEYVSEGVPFLSAQNVKDNKLILDKYNFITEKLHQQLTKNKKPKRGDILVTRVGAGIGDACIVDVDFEFSVYVSLTHIRVNESEVFNKFIMYFFSTDYCKILNSAGTVTGGGVGNLNVNNVKAYRVPLPSIKEQMEIVDYIEMKSEVIKESISKVEKEIELLQEYRTALILEVVTGKIKVV